MDTQEQPAPARRPRRGTLALVAATVLAAGLAVGAWYDGQRVRQGEEAGRECVPVATAAAQAVFSYDYRGFDAAVANGRSFTTGAFTDEYTQTTATLKETVIAEQAVVRAEVTVAGVVQAGADQVEVLVYVNQYRSNLNIDGEKVDQNRVVLTMVRTAAGWKVLHAAAI